MMKVYVTGGAGFIASHLDDLLVEAGHNVVAVDLFAEDDCKHIAHLQDNPLFEYKRMDLGQIDKFVALTKDADIIFHLAANSDIQCGGQNPEIDFNNTLLSTKSVLEAMRLNKIPKLFFSSTSAVYGNIKGDLNELTGGLMPISYYGAAKLASEAKISAYSFMNDFDALIFRFPNVIGPRLTHGVIFDFIKKLKANPNSLQILGNGKQNKQYVYVTDLVNAIVDFSNRMGTGVNLYNISTESFTDVNTIADLVCERMGLSNVEYTYTGGECGWKGDVPSFSYDVSKAKKSGWHYKFNSTESVKETLRNVNLDTI